MLGPRLGDSRGRPARRRARPGSAGRAPASVLRSLAATRISEPGPVLRPRLERRVAPRRARPCRCRRASPDPRYADCRDRAPAMPAASRSASGGVHPQRLTRLRPRRAACVAGVQSPTSRHRSSPPASSHSPITINLLNSIIAGKYGHGEPLGQAGWKQGLRSAHRQARTTPAQASAAGRATHVSGRSPHDPGVEARSWRPTGWPAGTNTATALAARPG